MKDHIFQSSSNETIIGIYIWTFIRKYVACKLWFQKFERQLVFFSCFLKAVPRCEEMRVP